MENKTTIEELLHKVISDVEEIKNAVCGEKQITKDDYIDIETICQVFKISKDSLRRYRNQGLIPFYKVKGKVYFIESEVKLALKKHYYGG